MKMVELSGDMKTNLNCRHSRGPRVVGLFLQRTFPSPGSISGKRDLDIQRPFFFCMMSSCSVLQKKFVLVFKTGWRGETFPITTVAAQPFFHARQDKTISTFLISHKENINAIEIFSLHRIKSKCTTSNAREHRG